MNTITEIDIATGEPREMYVLILHPEAVASIREDLRFDTPRQRYYHEQWRARYNRRAQRLGARQIGPWRELVGEVGSW